MIQKGSHGDTARAISLLQGAIAREAEMGWLMEFIQEESFDAEASRGQLCCLWTAYCLHHGLDVDTSGYDNDLLVLWAAMAESSSGAAGWDSYDSFDSFMCRYLV